jgi:hypothetical protein
LETAILATPTHPTDSYLPYALHSKSTVTIHSARDVNKENFTLHKPRHMKPTIEGNVSTHVALISIEHINVIHHTNHNINPTDQHPTTKLQNHHDHHNTNSSKPL